MGRFSQYFTRQLTPLQIASATALLAVMAGLVYAGYLIMAARILEAHISAAMPTICSEVRQQRAAILNAIELYKTQFGTFPPDHLVSRQPVIVDPVTNTLLYELTGVLLDERTRKFQVAGLEPADESYVTNFFQCGWFHNCSSASQGLKQLLPKEETAWRQLHDDPDVFVLAYTPKSEAISAEVFWNLDFTSWRYVATAPTNNPGKFDLWMEIRGKKRSQIIGNWKRVE